MKNTVMVDKTLETVLAELGKKGRLQPVDPAPYQTIRVYGVMKFQVEQYILAGVGNVSTMKMHLGPLMSMATAVVTPFEVDAPLMSVDLICMTGSRKVYLEYYDLVVRKDENYRSQLERLSAAVGRFDTLPAFTPKPAWYGHLLTVAVYRGCKAEQDDTALDLLRAGTGAWVEMCGAVPVLDPYRQAEKRRIISEYTSGLVEKGGISTDTFKKALGEETTRDFFGRVFFGTGRNRV